MGTNGGEKIYINLLHYPVHSLGMGKRIGVWFQGCNLRCKGCISTHTWELSSNCERSVTSVFDEILSYKDRGPEGITISGGEPFNQAESMKKLLLLLRTAGFGDIMVYSGYSQFHLKKRYPDILSLIDVLIDGRFKQGLETEYHWKGSENQKMFILTKDRDLREKYRIYKKKKGKREVQLITKGDGVYVTGIPAQKDAEAIKNGFCQGMPNM